MAIDTSATVQALGEEKDNVKVQLTPTPPEFTPMPWSLKEIREQIPEKLFIRKTWKGLLYLARDMIMCAAAFTIALRIDPFFKGAAAQSLLTPTGAEVARWGAWSLYWWFQGLIVTGLWVIGHECNHGAFSDFKTVNNTIGFTLHTLLWTPYFSWRISHHRHHYNHASMEKDEVYVPKTREDLNIPDLPSTKIDWDEIFVDTPLYNLFMLVRQQLLAFPAYLLFNVSGQKTYPKWTNHFDPGAILFTKEQRNSVILSNIGIAAMVHIVTYACTTFGAANVFKYYGIPWMCLNHWFTMITYLQHTDASLPHYRESMWNFQRGAASTVDRDFLGWQGRFFLHDVAHYHVIHHFFPKMPFYNGKKATGYLKAFIGDHYARSHAPVFQTLWRTYNDCQFVDNEGDVLFYRNQKGEFAGTPLSMKDKYE